MISVGGLHMFLNEQLRKIVGENNYLDITSNLVTRFSLRKYYNQVRNEDSKPYIIYMADGRTIHGGLADRLRGLVSLYMYSKDVGAEFKANFISPFNLKDYLVPNAYNWCITESELSYNNQQAKPIIVKHSRKNDAKYMASRLGQYANRIQLHVYTNSFTCNREFSKSFYELFKPSVELQKQIDYNISEIGSEFISITFRFQQLLGDFKEGSYKMLDGLEREKLILSCLNFINEVHESHPDVPKILVTSDSKTFLERANTRYRYVYTIPGELRHIDYSDSKQKLAYLKSFVDLFVLSHAKELYNYSEGEMYKESGFAMFASVIGDKKFHNVHR